MTYQPDSRVQYIVQHYSATPIESDFTAADIDRMHRARSFREIGYHYFIRKNGMVETGRDMSQPGKFEVGAHCRGSNSNSIGICVEGGVTRAAINVGVDNRTPAQIDAQIKLIRELLVRFPNAEVVGHKDMPEAATQCPGYDAAAWWASVVASVAVRKPSKSEPQNAKSEPQNAKSEPQGWFARILELLASLIKGSRT